MEGQRGRPRQRLVDWMMENEYWKLKEIHNIEKSGVVGYLDLPGGRPPKEEKNMKMNKKSISNIIC